MSIAKKHLWSKQVKNHGIPLESVSLSLDALNLIALKYTREAGVRSLERELASVCRSLAVKYADAKEAGRLSMFDGNVTEDMVRHILGVMH